MAVCVISDYTLPAPRVSSRMATPHNHKAARNNLPLDKDRYDALRLACHRWRDELTQWQAELQAALPPGEPLAEREHDATINAIESLIEASESVAAAYQWATGLVSEVKVKELT